MEFVVYDRHEFVAFERMEISGDFACESARIYLSIIGRTLSLNEHDLYARRSSIQAGSGH